MDFRVPNTAYHDPQSFASGITIEHRENSIYKDYNCPFNIIVILNATILLKYLS